MICEWSDKTPLVILLERTQEHGTIITLNMFPVSGNAAPGSLWDPTTDGHYLMFNCAYYASQRPNAKLLESLISDK